MAEHTMLSELLKKKAAVLKTQDEIRKTSPNASLVAAINEVDRQTKQVSTTQKGDPISGKGITKSSDPA